MRSSAYNPSVWAGEMVDIGFFRTLADGGIRVKGLTA